MLCLICIGTLPALAQSPPAQKGFRIKNGKLHVSASADTSWETNPSRAPNSLALGRTSDLVSNFRTKIRYVRPSPIFAFDISGSFDYVRYWGLERAILATSLSAPQGGGRLRLVVNPRGTLQATMRLGAQSLAQPGPQSSRRMRRMVTDTCLELNYRPGGGALVFSGAYDFAWERYNRDTQIFSSPESLDNLRHTPKLKIAWKFFPKTAIYAEVSSQISQFPNSDLLISNSSDGANQSVAATPNSNGVEATLGINGTLSPKVTFLAEAGYANALLPQSTGSTQANFQAPTGRALLRYRFAPEGMLRVGAGYGYQPVTFYRFLASASAFFEFRQTFTHGTDLNMGATYKRHFYGRPNEDTSSNPTRADHQLKAQISISQALTSWLSLAIVDVMDWRLAENMPSIVTTEGSYTYNRATFRIDIDY